MTEPQTHAAELARKYIELGGTRRSKLDDNIISTRQWEDEPEQASRFWESEIANLPEKHLREVETHLPSMNDL